MKSDFGQIQSNEKNKYKIAFIIHFGDFEWNVTSLLFKNTPIEFQNIINEIFTPFTTFSIVCIDDILIFSEINR